MSKYALYTKSSTENNQHINMVEMPSITQAEAYFAGVKKLSLIQLRELFIVKEIDQSNKSLLYGNR
tara:strand:+ start:3491 stop:3688 length:198 start_codon:yes stop_codon:yes gene_type:complete